MNSWSTVRRFLKQVVGDERGQALPVALVLLVLGGLMIVPTLDYAATGLDGGRVIGKGVRGIYAAEAGVEYVLWCLDNAVSPPEQLPEIINGMDVSIQTEETGDYTQYFGEVVQAGSHSNYIDVDGEMVWDGEAQAYRYTVTVTWQPDTGQPTIHLEEVGARLPIGYSYQSGSAAGFANNLSPGEPGETLDTFGACMLQWELGEPLPSVSEQNPVETQTFYITGEGSDEGHYAWVVASREDIGSVGQITGTLYRITAIATHNQSGEITARIVADVMPETGAMHIISWQISR